MVETNEALSFVPSCFHAQATNKYATLNTDYWLIARLILVLLEVRDQITLLLFLLQSGENHLGAGDVCLRVLEVHEKMFLGPRDSRFLVGVTVRKSFGRAGGAAKETEKVGALLGEAALLDSVALCALGLENLGTLLGVAIGDSDLRFGTTHIGRRK